MSVVLRKHVRNEQGQTYVEYALLLAVIAVGFALSWTSLGAAIQNTLSAVGNAL